MKEANDPILNFNNCLDMPAIQFRRIDCQQIIQTGIIFRQLPNDITGKHKNTKNPAITNTDDGEILRSKNSLRLSHLSSNNTSQNTMNVVNVFDFVLFKQPPKII